MKKVKITNTFDTQIQYFEIGDLSIATISHTFTSRILKIFYENICFSLIFSFQPIHNIFSNGMH